MRRGRLIRSHHHILFKFLYKSGDYGTIRGKDLVGIETLKCFPWLGWGVVQVEIVFLDNLAMAAFTCPESNLV
jgi:hypothetical protein